MSGEIRVRCIGTPVEVGGREEPTEIDLVQPCGWEGTAQVPVGERLDDHCPMCDGVVERADPKVEQPRGGDAVAEVPALHSEQALWKQRLTEPATATDPMGAVTGPSDPKVEQTTTTTPDKVEQAIQAAMWALMNDDAWVHWDDADTKHLTDVLPSQAARIAVEAAAPILLERLAQVDPEGRLEAAREQVVGLQKENADLRATRAELAVLRHSNAQLRVLAREQDEALRVTRERLAEVERGGGT
jgi:hypothetical protein